jgi:hypothetical protein
LEIMNLIAHLFHNSRAIRPQHMRKVGLHAELSPAAGKELIARALAAALRYGLELVPPE